MDETQLNDLKQFIATTVSQATANMVTKDDLRIQIDGLDAKIDRRFDETLTAIADTMTNSNDSVDEHLEAHEQRLAKLEQRTA